MRTSLERVLKHFEYKHLPKPRQALSVRFYQLAHHLVGELQDSDDWVEVVRGLYKLLEAKDCFERALLGTVARKPKEKSSGL